jgi:hypothetical protein
MGNTEKEVRELTKNAKHVCHDTDSLRQFEKSAKEFQNLIDNGMAKPRGYNLQTIEDRTCTSDVFEFNLAQ